MSALLIVGLTIFLMGTVMLGMDAQHRGRSSLMFALPFAGSGYIRHFWSDVWLAALLRVAGATLVLISGAVAVARDPLVLEQPRRLFGVSAPAELVGSKRAEINTFANSQEAVLLAIRSDANPMLSGRLRGQPFLYSHAKLVGGVLSAQQGEGFIPDIEVRILLDLDPATVTQERQTFYVRPADESAPELQITWRAEDGSTPHTEIIRGGYQMELQLTRRDAHTLTGFMQVILPDPDRSYLSGELAVRTNNLRFIKDRVDLTYDHPDTLEYVGRQYLETQFPEKTVSSIQFSDTRLLMSESGGVSVATITLVNGRIEQRDMKFDRADIGWAVRPGKMETRVLAEGGNQQLRLVVPGAAPQRGQVVAEAPPPVTLEFASLDTLNGQQGVIYQVDGRTREGILRGLRRNRLFIESNVAGGTAEFSYAEQELKYIVLASGQQVLLAGVELAEGGLPEVQPVVPESTATSEAQEPETLSEVAETALEFTAMVGREVTITSRDTRTRTGILTAVTERQLTLSVRVGTGSLEYFYSPADIVSLTEVTR
ncbi:hypothetical protein [Alcanivorax sp. 1008]|uniref:hypothetical protein n=1 Tax=Alcanivorax sp. 1008 TaxID=2816853 RepID=UPI001E36E54C|nr:hypothetical protein [Alcanivorax sp. 1008]